MDALIVDDKLKGRIYPEIILNRFFSEMVKKTTTVALVDEAAEHIKQHKPDLIFPDIEMPCKNGFELLKMFRDAINKI